MKNIIVVSHENNKLHKNSNSNCDQNIKFFFSIFSLSNKKCSVPINVIKYELYLKLIYSKWLKNENFLKFLKPKNHK